MNKADIELESVGCVIAMEAFGLKLSATVSMTSTDLSRILEGMNVRKDDKTDKAYQLVIKDLLKKIKTVRFSSPISSCGRVKLVPDIKSTDVQKKYLKMLEDRESKKRCSHV